MSLTTEPIASHHQDCACEKCLSALRHGELLSILNQLLLLLAHISDNTKK